MADSANAASASNEVLDLGSVFNQQVLPIVGDRDLIGHQERSALYKVAKKRLDNKRNNSGKFMVNRKLNFAVSGKYKLKRPDGSSVIITLTGWRYWVFVADDYKVDVAAVVVVKIEGQEELTTEQVLSTTPYYSKNKHPIDGIPAKLKIVFSEERFTKPECNKIQKFFKDHMYKLMVVAAAQNEVLLASNSAGKQQRRLAKKDSENKMAFDLAMQNSKTIAASSLATVENSKAIGRVDERVTNLSGRMNVIEGQVNDHDDTIHIIQDTLQAHKRQTISDINRLSQLLGSQEMSPSNIKASSGRGIGSPAFNFPLDGDENAGTDAISPIRRSFGPGFGGSPAFNFSPGGDENAGTDETLDSSSTRLKPTEPTMSQIERVQIDSAKKLSLDEADARSLDNQFEAHINMNVLAAQKDEAQKDEERKAAAATAASTKKDEEAEAAAAAAQKDEGTKTAATAPPAADAAETVPAAGFSFGGNTTIATGSTTTATPGVTATATTPVPGFSFGTSTTTASAGLGGGGTAAAVPPSSSSTATVKDISRAQCEQLIGTSPGVTIMNTSHNRNADTTTPKSDTTTTVDQLLIPSSLNFSFADDAKKRASAASFGLRADASRASSSPAAATAAADPRPSGKSDGSPASSGLHGKENCKPNNNNNNNNNKFCDAKKSASTAAIESCRNKLPLEENPSLLTDPLDTIEEASVGSTIPAPRPKPAFQFGTSAATAPPAADTAGVGTAPAAAGGGAEDAVVVEVPKLKPGTPSSSSTATVKDIIPAQCEQPIGTSPVVTVMNTPHNRNAGTTTPKSDTTSLVDQGDIPSSLDTPSPTVGGRDSSSSGSKVSCGLGKDASPASSTPAVAAAVADLRPSGKLKTSSFLSTVGTPASSGSHGKENCKPIMTENTGSLVSGANVSAEKALKLPKSSCFEETLDNGANVTVDDSVLQAGSQAGANVTSAKPTVDTFTHELLHLFMFHRD